MFRQIFSHHTIRSPQSYLANSHVKVGRVSLLQEITKHFFLLIPIFGVNFPGNIKKKPGATAEARFQDGCFRVGFRCCVQAFYRVEFPDLKVLFNSDKACVCKSEAFHRSEEKSCAAFSFFCTVTAIFCEKSLAFRQRLVLSRRSHGSDWHSSLTMHSAPSERTVSESESASGTTTVESLCAGRNRYST
jgi:hypothetical protein